MDKVIENELISQGAKIEEVEEKKGFNGKPVWLQKIKKVCKTYTKAELVHTI